MSTRGGRGSGAWICGGKTPSYADDLDGALDVSIYRDVNAQVNARAQRLMSACHSPITSSCWSKVRFSPALLVGFHYSLQHIATSICCIHGLELVLNFPSFNYI